jgi:hypothetical protein
MSGDRRERQTLIPAFDPEALARELEEAEARPTITPAYDPTSYARMVDQHVEGTRDPRDTPRTMTAMTPIAQGTGPAPSVGESMATIGRAMYGCYLSSDYPEALVLAERVLEREPDHALAQLVIAGCRERLDPSEAPRLLPSSVLRLKRVFDSVESVELDRQESAAVLGHVDGIASVSMVAALAGIPRPEALDRLHALLAIGVVEVVNE